MPRMKAGHDMTKDIQCRADDDRARSWLLRQLQWEQILGGLRDAGRGQVTTSADEEPAAA
jgi:hypothetical protein